MLMLTLFVMGTGTFLIGLLPSYAQIGVWAPILLVVLRVIQGIGLGGEWGGASLMVIEHAPAHRRGFYGSLVQVGFPLGLVTSSGVFAIVTMMPEADFQAWGLAHPVPDQHRAGRAGRVRARAHPGDAGVRGPEGARRHRRQPVPRGRAPASARVLRRARPEDLGSVVGLHADRVVVVYATTKLGLPKALLLNAILLGRVDRGDHDPAVSAG